MKPTLIQGNCHQDERGSLKYNNDFNALEIKRIYTIENANIQFKRGWQGHKVEQRWFSAVSGKFTIQLIQVDDWERPDSKLEPFVFKLSSETLDILHVPAGYISCIQSESENAKLLVMADFSLGEIKDEYKYALEQFECTKN
jgi:dTDP-4-dehydrorhamnose 3,5-epimerase-like enzyme